MTLIDENKAAETKSASLEAFCPFTTPSSTLNQTTTTSPETTALTPDGAYTADVLRIVRGTPNPDELAALVAALLLTRRAHGAAVSDASSEEHHRPSWPREGFTSPAAWTAGP